jgi:hypothetical protein
LFAAGLGYQHPKEDQVYPWSSAGHYCETERGIVSVALELIAPLQG